MFLDDIYYLYLKGPLSALNYERPYPQADSVHKVKLLVTTVHQGITSKLDIQRKLNFAPDPKNRQATYYIDAAEFLGFLNSESSRQIRLTELGERFISSDASTKDEIMVSQMLGIRALRKGFEYELDNDQAIEFLDLRKLVIHDSKLGPKEKKLTYTDPNPKRDDTPSRRAKTTLSWIKWIFALAD